MGDLINKNEIFKKLGVDSSNQWIFYDQRFQNFFSFFAEHITDANILTEHEILECNELKKRNEYLSTDERKAQLLLLEREYPGLLKDTDSDIKNLTNEVKTLETANEMYTTLVEDMRTLKATVNYEYINLEDDVSELVNSEKILYTECIDKSKELQELQKENRKLSIESKECFTKIQSPPLFIHQLPLEQYLLKCDSFMQYLSLYVTENFKIQNFLDLDLDDLNDNVTEETVAGLEKIRKLHLHYSELCIKEKAKAKATQAMIDSLDVSQMHIISLTDMKKETRELEQVNHHHFNITYDTLLADLVMHIQQSSQQQIELILYENTKEKLNRACCRRENVKRLAQIVSDALSNAELVWIAIQLDLEKIRNRFDNNDHLNAETQKCMRRIDAMKSLQTLPSNSASEVFVTKISEILSNHLTVKIRNAPKTCLYEYEKLCRMLKYALHSVVNKKGYVPILDILKELNQIEQTLNPLVYDSPVLVPMFENINVLKPIFKAKMNQIRNVNRLRSLRLQFKENIDMRMANDKLWRNRQLLWIWFLTEPKRVINAIEEVKKVAAKNPPITGVKTLIGIKRK